MRPWKSAPERSLLIIPSALLACAALGCGGDGATAGTGGNGGATGGNGGAGGASPMSSTGGNDSASSTGSTMPATETLTVHYYRPLADYDGTTLQLSGDVSGGAPITTLGMDAFGATFKVPLKTSAQKIGLTLLHGKQMDPPGELPVDVPKQGKEVWIFSSSARVYTAAPAIPAQDTAIVYYRRNDDTYNGWGLHVWGDGTTDAPSWDKPLAPTGTDVYGAYFTVHLKPGAASFNFILHNGDTKDPGPDMSLTPATQGKRIWIASGDTTVYTYPAAPGLLDGARAHWVSANTIAWNPPIADAALATSTFALYAAPLGGMTASDGKITGGQKVTVTLDLGGQSPSVKTKFPHLASYKAFKLDAATMAKADALLKGQLLIAVEKTDGKVLAVTGLQTPGVLDELYTYSGPLGATWGSAPSLALWAPTALSVKLHLFASPLDTTAMKVVPMTASKGVWSTALDPSWKNGYYLYEVEVYAPTTGKVEHNFVTDPYSVSLSANSGKSQLVDLADAALTPAGWDALAKPKLASPADVSLYELHVRDFSISDQTVPQSHRGTFLAFTDTGSNGMKHLSRLAKAGLSHVHLLPFFDFSTVNEQKGEQKTPPDLTKFAPDGTEQQAAIGAIRDADGFNWGYDPWHFTVPEGSYATDPTGSARTLELRKMVAALNGAQLRVVMDVVYNHTVASGQDSKSVLDRVVPGYYHRLDDKGVVTTSTCCQNTASEHAMMEKLIIDSVVTWARAYKIDGFRFDLMGHIMKSTMVKLRGALDALTPATDGVTGSAIYLYGEGWDYGEVGNNARGVNATQRNMAGTGIGTFNDRIRDAIRGGGPFDGGQDLKKQGFVSGLFYDPNGLDQGTPAAQKDRLLLLTDQLRVGLTGNLKDYAFVDRTGKTVTGEGVDYNGAPVGYTSSPVESINYVEAHDNQTLFDILQYKAPDATTMQTRVRMQALAMSALALGQGIPFFHAGMEMLRSKSMDRDSYNSGDWFNKLDFSYQTNNFGVGLPPQASNGDNWPIMKPLLADLTRRPAPADIMASVANLEELLAIRASSPLFRLQTGADVMARLRFQNTGAAQIPGLVVMSVSDEVASLPDLDPQREAVVVLINATPQKVDFTDPYYAASALTLHPVQQASADPVVKTATFGKGVFSIPARSAAVFVGTGNFPN